ncbi:MAG: MotA/TolQ/ExbB proton channel family protein [Planctomycetota bacterium]
MNLPTAPPGSPRRTWPRLLVLAAALLAAGATLTLRAQDTPGDAPPPAAETVVPALPSEANFNDLDPIYQLRDMYFFSPVINGIIAGLSVLALMFFLWFLVTINSRTVAPAAFVNEITNLVLVRRYDAAADACRRSKGVFIAPIILRCVENHGKNQSIIMSMIDTEGRRLSDIIWNRISYLADISNVAPMLGLLGTVIGMITAFFGLDKESGSINSSVLSQGVGQAMATTMFGLMVGITALVFYSIIKSRATKTLAEAEFAVHSIADRIRSVDEDDDTGEPEPPSKLL